ncbi:MAG: TIR domain-containing protein [Pseudomonadota bacterium]
MSRASAYDLFVSYARADVERVSAFLRGLQAEGISVWLDVDDLRPGVSWQAEIEKALTGVPALMVFVSSNSLKSKWVTEEFRFFREKSGKVVLTVLLDSLHDMPSDLRDIQWIDASGAKSASELEALARRNADRIGDALRNAAGAHDSEPKVDFSKQAKILAESSKGRAEKPSGEEEAPPDSVFIIHGHDEGALEEVSRFLIDQDIRPVVLKRIGGPDQSLWQKFKRWSRETRYAIAILTPDDFGTAVAEFEAEFNDQVVGVNSLQYRARQNVILELGYFYGYLDWDRVFVLFKPPSTPFPRFEIPSDLAGIVYDTMDDSGEWRHALGGHLTEAGFSTDSIG